MTSSSHFRSKTYKQTLKNKTNFLFMKLVGRSAGAPPCYIQIQEHNEVVLLFGKWLW